MFLPIISQGWRSPGNYSSRRTKMPETFTLNASSLSQLFSTWDGEPQCRDLSQDLGTTPGPKSTPTNKPTAPPDHIFSIVAKDFWQAFFDNDVEEKNNLLSYHDLHMKTSMDLIKFNCS